jgi:chorismate synthase
MIAAIDDAKAAGDTLGGVFEVIAGGVIPGVGSSFSWHEKLDGRIAQAIMSVHAVKAVAIGTAIANAACLGSEVHDEIFLASSNETNESQIPFVRKTNRAGGLEGGITNGEEIRVRGHLKPISTLKKPLRSVDIETKQPAEAAYERSDVTVVPAAGVIGEAMLAIVLASAYREKFGGDSLEEMLYNFQGYRRRLSEY